LDSLITNAGVTGFGLLITAIVQTVRKQLDLYHAIFVLHMIYYLGVIVYLSGYLRNITSLFRPAFRAIVQMVIIGTFLGWSTYVWAHAKTFGSSPECNAQVTYVFFFYPVRATVTWLRLFWVYGFAITAGLPLLGILSIVVRACNSTADVNEDDRNIENFPLSRSGLVSALLTFLAVLAIVLLESLVHRNKHLILPGEGEWTFGQVLSIVMIVSSLKEVLKLMPYLWKRYVWVVGPNLNVSERPMYGLQ